MEKSIKLWKGIWLNFNGSLPSLFTIFLRLRFALSSLSVFAFGKMGTTRQRKARHVTMYVWYEIDRLQNA